MATRPMQPKINLKNKTKQTKQNQKQAKGKQNKTFFEDHLMYLFFYGTCFETWVQSINGGATAVWISSDYKGHDVDG